MKNACSQPLSNSKYGIKNEKNRDIYFELPDNGKIVDDCVIYVSLYQDGFTARNDNEITRHQPYEYMVW